MVSRGVAWKAGVLYLGKEKGKSPFARSGRGEYRAVEVKPFEAILGNVKRAFLRGGEACRAAVRRGRGRGEGGGIERAHN